MSRDLFTRQGMVHIHVLEVADLDYQDEFGSSVTLLVDSVELVTNYEPR